MTAQFDSDDRGTETFTVVEATLDELRTALEVGVVTSVELVARYLNRIAFYDRHGILLNAVPVLNPAMFAEAAASDARRARGETLGPLDGIPYTAKDSYKVRGLTVASGTRLRRSGRDGRRVHDRAAAGGRCGADWADEHAADGERGHAAGLYGRAESPYNAEYLTSAFGSGSSNGSGTATAASFAAFGLGEETWSSGRAPASCNALVAYTPSRGIISTRGNWPLVPTMDVVVPHTRTVADLLTLLNVIVAEDPESRGDLWRTQPWIELPTVADGRPADYRVLVEPAALAGQRIGVPRMYINADDEAVVPIETRASVIELWQAMRADLEALGAEVIEVDFPVVSNYERDRPGARTMVERGFVPAEFALREIRDLSVWAWDEFLQANGDPSLHRLADVDSARIFPQPTGALPDQYGDDGESDLDHYVPMAKAGVSSLTEIPTIEAGLRGLEQTRKVDFEDWMDELGLAAVVFPAVADIGPADADVNPESAEIAWRNGVAVANGNLVPRHLGIPTVTVPMGTMADIGMPVGLTIAGRAYDDTVLLDMAAAIEGSRSRRTVPPRTPAIDFPLVELVATPPVVVSTSSTNGLLLTASATTQADGTIRVEVTGTSDAELVRVWANGVLLEVSRDGDAFAASVELPAGFHDVIHSEWRGGYGTIVVGLATASDGRAAGRYIVVGGVE